MKKAVLILATLAITPWLMSEDASAQCLPGYPVYRAPVVVTPNVYRGYPPLPYRSQFRGYPPYRSPYRYAPPYRGYGYRVPYYSRRPRGGVTFSFGF